MEKAFLYILIVISFGFLQSEEVKEGVSYSTSPTANGTLKLMVRKGGVKYLCEDVPVKNGEYKLCDENKRVDWDFFIHRDVTDGSWLNDVVRQYDVFPDVSKAESELNWYTFEKRSSEHYKEDFTSNDQKNGITFRHHESKKSIITYSIANPKGEACQKDKMHFQYDWEENVKGKYETFYTNGKKRFRHKYLVNRFMILLKNVDNSRRKSSMEVNIDGTIESYYQNGKKKELIVYQDLYTVSKAEDDNARKLRKVKRTGMKTTFYETGKPFCKGEFDMDGFQGKVECFSKKGVVIKIEEYEKGVLNGATKEFYDSGELKLVGKYKEGKKIGEWKMFNENGKKKSSIKY